MEKGFNGLAVKIFGNAYSSIDRSLVLSEIKDFCKTHVVTDIKYLSGDGGNTLENGRFLQIVVTYIKNDEHKSEQDF